MSNPLDDLPPVETTPSAYVNVYGLSRAEAESLERHLTSQDTRRWTRVLKKLRSTLEHHANGKRYPWQKEEKP